MLYKANQVFMPGAFPTLTYIERQAKDYETILKDALEIKGQIISLAGPSKSGKTVLVEKVVGKDNLIAVTGAGVDSPDRLWERVLNWMDAPSETGSSAKTERGGLVGGEVRADVGAPGAKFQLTGRVNKQNTAGTGESKTFKRRGMQQVVEEIANSDFVILIDDFHYMDKSVQDEVAKQIKEAARQGVAFIAASVLHRSDDVVRALPELRGRVMTIDIDYWSDVDLKRIAEIGFRLLNFEINAKVMSEIIKEAAGSPQLMQSICLFTCLHLDIRESLPLHQVFHASDINKSRIMERTVASADFRSLVDVLDSGPKTRGIERKIYKFKDGVSGDVYRCVLKAVAANPPALSFPYDKIVERVILVCDGESPVGSSITGTCLQMSKLAQDNFPKERAIDWDEQKQVLDIPDPYLLFYLRWSERLMELEN